MTGAVAVLSGATSSSGAFIFAPTINADTYNYNVGTAAALAGWNGAQKLNATITINSGKYVGSTSAASPAFTVPSLPSGSTVTIINSGFILGKGGAGNGGAGGLALSVATGTLINNASGTIGGGGGGGAQGNGPDAGGGGGGQGFDGGAGGSGSGIGSSSGDAGNRDGAGNGGSAGDEGGDGGDGGSLGANGSSSGAQAGGLAGACTSGGSNITWLSNGTRLGALN